MTSPTSSKNEHGDVFVKFRERLQVPGVLVCRTVGGGVKWEGGVDVEVH